MGWLDNSILAVRTRLSRSILTPQVRLQCGAQSQHLCRASAMRKLGSGHLFKVEVTVSEFCVLSNLRKTLFILHCHRTLHGLGRPTLITSQLRSPLQTLLAYHWMGQKPMPFNCGRSDFWTYLIRMATQYRR